jgi:putative ABC transport system substrate-binding protein
MIDRRMIFLQSGRRSVILAALGGAAASWGRGASARGIARIAWIAPGTAATEAKFAAALREGLADNGLGEGRDYVLDTYYAEGDYGRFPALTQQALASAPDVLMVVTIASVKAAQQATKTTPLVLVATNDPVGAGLIDSLARPGGHTTGVATMADQTAPKLMELLHAALPEARRVAILVNPQNPSNRQILPSAQAAGAAMGLDVQGVEVSSPDGLAAVFGAGVTQPPGAVVAVSDALFTFLAGKMAALAIERGIALVGASRNFAEAGALMSYGVSFADLVRRSAYYVRRILDGTSPRDLPVEQPTKFELLVNLKTAKALGLTMPPMFLARCDEVID